MYVVRRTRTAALSTVLPFFVSLLASCSDGVATCDNKWGHSLEQPLPTRFRPTNCVPERLAYPRIPARLTVPRGSRAFDLGFTAPICKFPDIPSVSSPAYTVLGSDQFDVLPCLSRSEAPVLDSRLLFCRV